MEARRDEGKEGKRGKIWSERRKRDGGKDKGEEGVEEEVRVGSEKRRRKGGESHRGRMKEQVKLVGRAGPGRKRERVGRKQDRHNKGEKRRRKVEGGGRRERGKWL